MENRYRVQAKELRRALGLASHYATTKKVANGASEKICQADQKRQAAEVSLRMALDSNTAAEGKIKAIEAQIAEAEKATFVRGRKEVEVDIASQLTSIYNESFQEGWKALYAWSGLKESPFLPPRDSLPYPDAPIGVEEEEAVETPSQPSASRVSASPPT